MKHLRVLLLLAMALMLLLGAASAEETKVEGFTIRPEGDEGCVIAGVPETALQDGVLLIPEKVGEKTVYGFLPSAVSEDVRLVIHPRDRGVRCDEDDAPEKTMRFNTITYAGFKELSTEELDQLPDMQKGEYALVNYFQTVVSRNGSVDTSFDGTSFLYEDQIPQELFGQKTYSLIRTSRIAQTEGDWLYTFEGEGKDKWAVIRRYSGNPDRILVIPDQLGGAYVNSFPFEIISDKTEYVYMPDECWPREVENSEENANRSFVMIRYISHERAVQNQSSLVKDISGFTEDTYAITSMEQFTYNGSSYGSGSVEGYIPAEEILAEINGKKVLNDWIRSRLINREGDWTYVLSNSQEPMATLMRYSGEPAENFVIPAEIRSYPVYGIALQAIPETAKTVYASCYTDIRTDERYNDEKKDRSLFWIGYMTYEQAKKDNAYLLENDPSFTEGMLAVTEFSEWRYSAAESGTRHETPSEPIPADTLLTEIEGKPLTYAQVRRYISRVSGEFAYTNDYEDRAVIVSMPATQELLLIPAAIDGLNVSEVKAPCIPDEVTALLLPRNCSLRSTDKLTHPVKVYSYMDYDMIHAEENISGTEALVKPGELYVHWPRLYTAEKNDTLVQDYCDYPTSYNGQKIHLSINRDSVLQHVSGTYTYYKVSDTEICICAFSDTEARKVAVPETIDGMTVVGINSLGGGRVFNVNNATEITLPSTLRTIGYYAISNSKAKNVTLPAGLKEIGEHGLHLNGVQNLTLPEGLESIGSYGIDLSYRAKKLVIPNSVTTLAPNAFAYTSGLQTVELPAGLTELPAELFKGFNRLTSISIPAGVTEIKESTFNGCSRLTKVVFQGTAVKKICDSAFVDCTSLGKIDLPEGIEEIGYQAFYGCKKLNNVTIPSTVTKIGASAFAGCKALGKVNIGENVTEIADDAFNECSRNITFFTKEGSYARQWAEAKGFKVKDLK